MEAHGQSSPPDAVRNLGAVMRDLHLYLGLFISPYVLVYAISVFVLVHYWLPKAVPPADSSRTATNLPLPANLDQLSGRTRIEALRPTLEAAGVHGEVGWVQHRIKENRLVIPVAVPGRITTVTIDLNRREASIQERNTGWTGALLELHKSPGPHLAGIRKNWFFARAWAWLADATVYLTLFLTLSGLGLWYLLRSERKAGLALLAAGGVSCFGLVYALIR